jgi:hypothetical protein
VSSRLVTPVPGHWVGAYKDWPLLCGSIGDALVEITPQQLATHALVIGATGSGKTNLLHHLIAGDLLRSHSIVLLDARGDLAAAAIELAARSGIDPGLVKFFNLREKLQPAGFNPLAGDGEPYFRALGLIDAVAAESDSWGVQLAETFRNASLLLAETSEPLTRLEGLFYDQSMRTSIVAKARSESLRAFWTRFGMLSSDRQAALASPVLNKISALLSTEGLRRMYGHPNPVALGDHLRRPGSITLISLAVDELHHAGWMTGSLFLDSICREVFSQVDIAESKRNPIRMYVDEFEHFSSNQFEAILAEGRRFRLAVVLAHQSLAQLSPKMRSLILGNVGVKLIFRTSHADADILNKDMTGVRGVFDLASLAVGEAVLWRQGDNPWPIEINAPLIGDVGRTSDVARKFLKESAKLVAPYYQIAREVPEGGQEKSGNLVTQTLKKQPGIPLRAPSLEDWLQ